MLDAALVKRGQKSSVVACEGSVVTGRLVRISRIPAIIVSPYARRGFVDSTAYDTTSIIKFITRRFGLEPLPGVRARAGDLTNAFDWSQAPAR